MFNPALSLKAKLAGSDTFPLQLQLAILAGKANTPQIPLVTFPAKGLLTMRHSTVFAEHKM